MKINTNISNIVEGNADKSKYDTEVKKVLSDKQILAWILKYTTSEFRNSTIEEIICCIDGEPEIGKNYVRPGHFKETVEGINTEDAVPGEGKITYDIRFRVILPHGEKLGMMINIEAQKDIFPGYDIVTRGVFYCARMLSSQMGNEISGKEYDYLQKVYSIWICLDVPKRAEHSMVRYRMSKENIHGTAPVKSRYDLMELVMVYLGREETAEQGTELHMLLSAVLSEELKPEEKKRILNQKYDIAVSRDLEGGLVSMCNLSEAIEEKGIEKGIEKGRLEVLSSLIAKGRLTIEEAAEEEKMEIEAFRKIYITFSNNKDY